jgi:pimeloyl-ACP methyl ester carboxylesterase
MMRAAASACAAGALLAVAGCAREHAPAAGVSALQAEPCAGVPDAAARCHRLTVYENHATRRGRTIALRIVVLPATGPRARDAVVYLAGGPGQAATEFLGDRGITVDGAGEQRDAVYADQRGTGGSHPLLCGFYGPADDPRRYFDQFLPPEKVTQCRAALEGDADLSQYTTAASVEDLEAMRAALGYEQLTLVGGSYGTRLAMEYLRRYESRVRAVILEGPVTPATHAPERFGQLAARALDGVLAECLATDACASAFPRIREEARAVFERLRTTPATTVAAHPSARRAAQVTLTRENVAEAIRYLLYSTAGASRVPLYLHDAYGGDFSSIAAFLIRWRARGTFDGLYLSATCAEDVPFVAAGAAEIDDATFLGGYRVREQRAACDLWPRGEKPAVSGEPVTSGVPVLIISGLLDPVTPPENGDVLARTLPRSLHVRVPSGGHALHGLQGLDCLEQLKRDFLARGTVDGLDASCVSGISRQGFVMR